MSDLISLQIKQLKEAKTHPEIMDDKLYKGEEDSMRARKEKSNGL